MATIKVNEEAKHSDGSFTITGLTIDLGGGMQVICLASATCAQPAVKPTPQPTHPNNPAPPQIDTPPAAPVPTPVKTHQPVTG